MKLPKINWAKTGIIVSIIVGIITVIYLIFSLWKEKKEMEPKKEPEPEKKEDTEYARFESITTMTELREWIIKQRDKFTEGSPCYDFWSTMLAFSKGIGHTAYDVKAKILKGDQACLPFTKPGGEPGPTPDPNIITIDDTRYTKDEIRNAMQMYWDLKEKHDQLVKDTADIGKLRAEIESLKATITKTKEFYSKEVQEWKSKFEAERTRYNKRNNEVAIQINDLEAQIAKLKRDLEQAEKLATKTVTPLWMECRQVVARIHQEYEPSEYQTVKFGVFAAPDYNEKDSKYYYSIQDVIHIMNAVSKATRP